MVLGVKKAGTHRTPQAYHRHTHIHMQGNMKATVDAPVVKVLVGDDPLDALVVRVGCRLRHGQHEGRVEDVEALV